MSEPEPDAYAQGFQAFVVGTPETYNPYDVEKDADAHCAWNDGWRAACEDV